MATPIVVQKDYTLTLERGATYNTAIDTAPIGLPSEDMQITQEPTAHELKRAWGVRGASDVSMWQNSSTTMPKATFAMPFTPSLLSGMLPALLQKSPNWAPAASVFTQYPVNYSGMPSPKTDNSGYFYTLTKRSQVASKSVQIATALMSQIKLSIHPTDNEGCLWGETEWVGVGYSRVANPSASVTHATVSGRYDWSSIGSVTISGTGTGGYGNIDLTTDFISANWTVTAGAKTVRDIPTTEFVFPEWAIEGEFVVSANTNTETLKLACGVGGTSSAGSNPGQASDFKVRWGSTDTIAAAGQLKIMTHCYLQGYTSDYAEGEVITYKFKGCFGSNTITQAPIIFTYHTTGSLT
jgi:hypothetical protein